MMKNYTSNNVGVAGLLWNLKNTNVDLFKISYTSTFYSSFKAKHSKFVWEFCKKTA